MELKKEYLKIQPAVIRKVCSLGTSSFITQIATVVVMILLNRLLVHYGALSKYGEDIPITALGVTMKINNILLAVFMGVASGCQPIISFNYGAGKKDRCIKTFRWAVIVTTACAAVATFFFRTCPMAIVSIFGSELYNEFAVKCLKVFLMLCIFDGFNNVAVSFLQAIGKPLLASISTLVRQAVTMIAAALVLPLFFGIDGVLYAGPFAVCFSAVVILFIILPQIKKVRGEK